MSLKVHFLNSHLELFPYYLGAIGEKKGDRSHQEIKMMEKRYLRRWKMHLMGDYSWSLHRESQQALHRKKSSIRGIKEIIQRKYKPMDYKNPYRI